MMYTPDLLTGWIVTRLLLVAVAAIAITAAMMVIGNLP